MDATAATSATTTIGARQLLLSYTIIIIVKTHKKT